MLYWVFSPRQLNSHSHLGSARLRNPNEGRFEQQVAWKEYSGVKYNPWSMAPLKRSSFPTPTLPTISIEKTTQLTKHVFEVHFDLRTNVLNTCTTKLLKPFHTKHGFSSQKFAWKTKRLKRLFLMYENHCGTFVQGKNYIQSSVSAVMVTTEQKVGSTLWPA